MNFGQSIRIKPAAGANVRKENGLYLLHGGETVIASNYWLRRLNAGDIEIDHAKAAGVAYTGY